MSLWLKIDLDQYESSLYQAGRWFNYSCFAACLTNLLVLARPDVVRVSLEDGTGVADGEIIGPFSQGQKVLLR